MVNQQYGNILKLIPGKVYLINSHKNLEYSNPAVKTENPNIPCHKAIFGLENPCYYCLFFNEDAPSSLGKNRDLKKVMQIKLPFDTERLEDITLSQSVIEIDNIFMIADVIYESPLPRRRDANDQLTTLGAHVQTMAHELSNPLTGLNLTFQKMESILNLQNQTDISEIKPIMELFKKDIKRASEIVSEIRNYSRPLSQNYKIINLKQVLKSAIESVTRVSGRSDVNLILTWNLARGFQVKGNPVKLEQCFINIIKNSYDMFNIRRNISNPKILINVREYKPEKSVLIEIIDNAGGISKSALKNVFKPYFTTKEKFRGQGLGLYIAGKILKEHQSTISIESIQETTKVTIKMKNQEPLK